MLLKYAGFDAETKSIIYNYLEAIAHADEELLDRQICYKTLEKFGL